MMKKPYPSVRMFENPILEKFSHVHPITPLVIWTPLFVFLMWRSFVVHQLSWMTVASVGVMGFLLWTLAEYVLHRFLFHLDTRTPLRERIQFLIHGVHHVDPVDPTRLVFPPAAGIIFCALFYTGFRFLMGPVYVDPFFAFFIVGYLCYDYIHFAVHHFTPRTRLGRFLKQSHMKHHYVSPHSRWGVSSPFWDYVFGTLEEAPQNLRHTAASGAVDESTNGTPHGP